MLKPEPPHEADLLCVYVQRFELNEIHLVGTSLTSMYYKHKEKFILG